MQEIILKEIIKAKMCTKTDEREKRFSENTQDFISFPINSSLWGHILFRLNI